MRLNQSAKNPECPAIAELADALEAAFAQVTLFTTNNESPGTRHTSGLAIDIMLDVTKTQQRQLAHGIIGVVVNRWSKLNWSDLLYSDYDGRSISYFHIPAAGGYGGQRLQRNPYTDDTRHGDHIHLDWVDFSSKNTGVEYQRLPYKWSTAAKTTGFSSAIAADFAALNAGTLDPKLPDSAAAIPIWLQGWWRVDDGNTYFYYFDKSPVVRYTKSEPKQGGLPIQSALNKGTVTVGGADRVTIDWNPADGGATREVLTRSADYTVARMAGTSNRYGSLTAAKMF